MALVDSAAITALAAAIKAETASMTPAQLSNGDAAVAYLTKIMEYIVANGQVSSVVAPKIPVTTDPTTGTGATTAPGSSTGSIT